jgi:hypothetical protein
MKEVNQTPAPNHPQTVSTGTASGIATFTAMPSLCRICRPTCEKG